VAVDLLTASSLVASAAIALAVSVARLFLILSSALVLMVTSAERFVDNVIS
jgi:hypothetical protein